MVRHSYIVCVEELEGLNIYDVFLVDSDFKVEWHALPGLRVSVDEPSQGKHHFFTITNSERTFKLGSESDKKMMQFIQSIQAMKRATPWSQKHRFGSFAPVRQHVQCQWLVDGVFCLRIPD
jgi:phospholipase D1/2